MSGEPTSGQDYGRREHGQEVVPSRSSLHSGEYLRLSREIRSKAALPSVPRRSTEPLSNRKVVTSRGALLTGGAASFPDAARIVAGKREQLRAPKDVQERLTRAGGRNFFGGPNFKLTWGWEPNEFIYNLREGFYELRPRYIRNQDRWRIEKWFGPDYYGTPRTWDYFYTQVIDGHKINLLGPFPTFGAYEQFCTLETPHQPSKEDCKWKEDRDCPCGGASYVSLTPSMIDEMVGLVERSRDVNIWERKRINEEAAIDKGYDQFADDIIEDALPAFPDVTWTALGNKWKGSYGTSRTS